MIKKIKKLYFKIYHLLKFLGCFTIFSLIYMNSCYAIEVKNYQYNFESLETSCSDNLLPPYLIRGTINNNSTVISTNDYYLITYFVEVKSNTTYRLKYDFSIGTGSRVLYFDSLQSAINGGEGSNSKNYTFTTGANTKYIVVRFGKSNNSVPDLTSNIMSITEGSEDKEYVEYKTECSTPVEPVDNVYSNFLTLYIDRINYLAEGFANNPYLIAMIGIILAWVVLELLLHIIHMKGGYKK